MSAASESLAQVLLFLFILVAGGTAGAFLSGWEAFAVIVIGQFLGFWVLGRM